MSDYTLQRHRMISQQLQDRGIGDRRVLAILDQVPREWFVPPDERPRAYADAALPIGSQQTISQPYMVALMTQELGLGGPERVLEIGTGSGYQTAVLAAAAGQVFTIERIWELSLRARSTLDALGYQNVRFQVGDGSLGWPHEAPFDRIIVTAMAPELPGALFAQLAEGGRMVIPIGTAERQALRVIDKVDDQPVSQDVCHCLFVPLIGAQAWQTPPEPRSWDQAE